MALRKELRVSLQLPVRIWGMDANGELFEQDAATVDITTTGAQLNGVTRQLHRGSVIGIQHRMSKARFRVMWIGIEGTPSENCIGVKLVEEGKYIWGQPVQRIMGDDYRPPQEASQAMSASAGD
jgi:hypothetical protein